MGNQKSYSEQFKKIFAPLYLLLTQKVETGTESLIASSSEELKLPPDEVCNEKFHV